MRREAGSGRRACLIDRVPHSGYGAKLAVVHGSTVRMMPAKDHACIPEPLITGRPRRRRPLRVGPYARLVLARAKKRHHPRARRPRPGTLVIGFVTNFFDTLGIGSFATTTALFQAPQLVPDEHIPGTLNVGHALPTVAQALIFIAAVAVDPRTLIAMIVAAVAGALAGRRRRRAACRGARSRSAWASRCSSRRDCSC